ncbi:MAG: DUF6064 family protein [Bacteroidales bacterium]|nr:DUF6064 family protein [Bacteroidales bacterium]
MSIPFSTEDFFRIIVQYNSSLFPVQIVIFLIPVAGLILMHINHPLKDRFTGVFLGLIWLWTGLAYHISFFAGINPAAYGFGGLFIIQGLMFLFETIGKKRLQFTFEKSAMHYVAYFFIIYGLLIYPVIEFVAEGALLKTISLGLPCPTTILTFGFLMLAAKKLPGYLLIIPTLWAVIGVNAAFNFGVYQDVMMVVAAITAVVWIMISKRKTAITLIHQHE